MSKSPICLHLKQRNSQSIEVIWNFSNQKIRIRGKVLRILFLNIQEMNFYFKPLQITPQKIINNNRMRA